MAAIAAASSLLRIAARGVRPLPSLRRAASSRRTCRQRPSSLSFHRSVAYPPSCADEPLILLPSRHQGLRARAADFCRAALGDDTAPGASHVQSPSGGPGGAASPRGRSLSSLVARAAVAAPPERKQAASPEVVAALGFEEVEGQFIEEYKANAVLYRHKKTGAEVMSVACDDENKVFGIVFRTPVEDSTGIPHILEHSVLCGSRKYPVKEPFVELIKGSLHTFLNAFTYPDRTCYPVASTNLQDFYNLVDVYLDAVFFPNCVRDEKTFQQEGWHYELNDPQEDITYKGVVFNEMKGVYSQPDALLGRITQQELFPNTTYHVDSGGDPKVIPSLTFRQFQEFHGKFYHPSNSRVWFYGDDDPDTRLRILAEYLDQFEANPSAAPASQVHFQPLFKEPKKVLSSYPVGEGEEGEGDEGEGASQKKQHMVSLNWLLAEQQLPLEEELALGFLDSLLLGTPGAPLRKRLLESGLGEALVSSGFDSDLLQPSFHVGMKGVAEEDVGKVEELILQILADVERDGFAEGAVEAAVNTAEFAARENNTGSFPRGLSLMLRSLGWWIYGRDPFEPLKFEAPLAAFKERLKTEGIKGVFSPLISKYILNNSHCVTVTLQPDASLAEQQEEEEKQKLAELKKKLQLQELEELVRATEELRERQETPDAPEALRAVPSLALEDIPREAVPIPRAVAEGDGVTFLRHDLFTNGVLYVDLALSMRDLPARLLPYLPLFCQSLKEMGTAELDFVALNELVGRKTGGVYFFPLVSAKRGSKDPECFLVARGKSTAVQAQDLLSLTRTLLQDVQLTDQGRFRQFVAQAKQRKESGIIGSGHSVAASRLDAMDNLAGWASEQMGGLSSLEFLRSLEKTVEEDWDTVQAALEEIRQYVVRREGAIVNLTADEATLAKAEGPVSDLLAALPAGRHADVTAFADWSVLPRANEALVVPTQVNYVGKGANLYSAAGYELAGSAYVANKVVGMNWLWDRVRVSGGAYGGFADFDSHSGMYTFLSYRDPNLVKTLDNYDAAATFLRELSMDEDALTKAIIGTISDVDAYQLPDAKGYSSLMRYILGVTDEERQQRREQILSTSVKDLQKFGEVLEAVAKEGTVVTVASQSSVDAANSERPGLLIPQRVL